MDLSNLNPILIGERVNVRTVKLGKAMKNREKGPIQEVAVKQIENGANMLDMNVGPCSDDIEVLPWIVETVQEVCKVPLCLDSTNVQAMDIGLSAHKNDWGLPLINSCSGEEERLNNFMPLAAKHNCYIIGLTLAGSGLPADANARASIAVDIMTKAAELGVSPEKILFDPLAMTVKGNQDQAMKVIEAITILGSLNEPPMKTVLGLSNIVSMCPAFMKPLLTSIYWTMLRDAGLSGAIIDPTDEEFMRVAKGEDIKSVFKPEHVDKSIRMFKGEILFADSFLCCITLGKLILIFYI
ncbi:dihydropteroate synthase [Candidatus Desantisbacteria bacterium]|nr:dihydropteroate synthase [Candidatus Desantisbacteria bacterium]